MLSADRAAHGFWVWGDPVASYGPAESRRMAWSFALAGLSLPLLCSLLARRSDRGRLHFGGAGLLVHLAAGMVVAVRLAGWAAQASIFALFEGRPGFYATRWTVEVLNYLGNDLRKDVVIAVLAIWLALAVVGRWNPERAWDDRWEAPRRRLGGLLPGRPLLALLP